MSLAEIVFQETLYNCAHKIKVFKIVIQQINEYNGYYISVIKIVATWKRQALKKKEILIIHMFLNFCCLLIMTCHFFFSQMKIFYKKVNFRMKFLMRH